ncbi:MAG: type III secretion system export apparatus subunit SctU [Pseudomonadota bacterium]
MSSNEGGEKTEQPTSKRLREAREKGNVVHSKEVSSSALTLAMLWYLLVFLPDLMEQMKQLILIPAAHTASPFGQALAATLDGMLWAAFLMVLPLLGVAIVASILGNFLQTGPLMAFESIKPDLKKLNPIEGMKKIFSTKNLIEVFKSLIKIFFIGWIIYQVVIDSLDELVKSPMCGMSCLLGTMGAQLRQLVIKTAPVFVVIAAVDYFLQRRMYLKDMMMSKDEVKREYKEMEGDPQIKGQRRQLSQEILNSNTMQKTRKATVLVTNPRHIAIALFYESDKTPLPMVLAKGENLIAKRMMEIAREEGIPIMENVPLARALLENGLVDQYIPADLIEPVAEVLKWVAQLERRR